MGKLKVVFCHELFPPDVAGGGEKLMLRLARKLKDDGHDVRVVTSGDPRIRSYGGIDTIRIPANRYLMNVLALPELIRQSAWADVVVASSGNMALPAYIAARCGKKPAALWTHHIFGKYWRDIRGPVLGRLFELAERVIFNLRFDAVVFQNESSRRLGLGMGVKKYSVRTMAPGVDSGMFHPAKTRRRRGVLFVGSVHMDEPAIRAKGLRHVLEAARMMPDVTFSVLGEFSRGMRRTPNVRWLGAVDQRGLAAAYRSAGVVVCASLNEGFGLSVLEAMACGCPIVSTVDIGQVGPKIKPKDAKAIADAARFYLGNPAKAHEDGMKNASLARSRTWEKFHADFEKLCEGLNKHRSK